MKTQLCNSQVRLLLLEGQKFIVKRVLFCYYGYHQQNVYILLTKLTSLHPTAADSLITKAVRNNCT